jgi:hypothetical protein
MIGTSCADAKTANSLASNLTSQLTVSSPYCHPGRSPSWPFTTVLGGFTHVLVAIDKFTKSIEYKPIAKLTPDRVVDFISDILHRFSFLNTIITDLGSNFTANQFWEFCENACIEVKYVSVAHPSANGQVERVNGMIIDGLKKRLYDENSKKGGKWIHELPHVV